MSLISRPAGLVYFYVFLSTVVSFVSSYKLDTKSCLPFKARVDAAMDEALAIVTYAEKRAAKDSPFIRQGTLLQDLLNASGENDDFALTSAGSAFTQVKSTIGSNKVIIHCDDKHLTKADGRNDLYFDNSNGRQARVQVLNAPNRKATACGGIMRAFEYDFLDKSTGRSGGKAIVLCSDSAAGALKAADQDKDITFWRDKDMRKVNEGVDFFGRYLSYMILHELFHAADEANFPVNPGGQPEKYGYQAITGHAVGTTADGGPDSQVRLHNADSYALLACGYFMNGYFFENGQFKLTAKRDRPPLTLRRRLADLKARARGGGSKPASGGSSKPKPAPAPAPKPPASKPPASQAPASQAPASQAPAASSPAAKPASSQPASVQSVSSAAASSSVPPSPSTTSTATVTPSSSSSSLSSSASASSSSSRSSSSSSVLPIETALGDAASVFPPIRDITFATATIPDVDAVVPTATSSAAGTSLTAAA